MNLTRTLATALATGAVLAAAACSVPNLPAPVTASSTLPVPTTTAPLVTPRTTQQSSAQTTEPTTATVGRVTSVYDGDTFTVTLDGQKEHVRVLGIDAPELENKGIGVAGQCYGKESGDALRALLTGTTVSLTIDTGQGEAKTGYRDKYGRLLRYVQAPLDTPDVTTATSTTDLGDYQLTHGNAWVYEQFPVERTPQYMTEMTKAQQDHAGLWAACE